jgi:hypothetical protein
MNKSFWKGKLMPFLEPHTDMGEDAYGWKKGKVAFWFEGGLKITGDNETLSLNLIDPDLMILLTFDEKSGTPDGRIYRVPYARLVCVEFIIADAKSTRREFLNRLSSN